MKDENKRKDQLINELKKMRKRITRLEVSEVESKRAVKRLQTTLEKLRKIMRGTIQVIAYTIETKDPYMFGHQQRVSDLARSIANEMSLPKNQVDEIRTAGLVHDVGKVGIPSEILSRPHKLTEFEFNLIKDHPKIGYDILKHTEFPWPIQEIVLQHHERINGSGYPQGLSNEEIRRTRAEVFLSKLCKSISVRFIPVTC